MFCSKCGTKLNDDAKFCAGCGAAQAVQSQPVQQVQQNFQQTPVQQQYSQYTQQQSYYPQAQGAAVAVKRKPKGVIIAAIALLVVAATVFSLIFFNDENTCKRTVDSFLTEFSKGNLKNAFRKYVPPHFKEMDKSAKSKGGWSKLEYERKNSIDTYDQEFVSWKITDVKIFDSSDDEFESIVKNYETAFSDPAGAKKITNYAEVTAFLTEPDGETDEHIFYLLKINGVWYINPNIAIDIAIAQ